MPALGIAAGIALLALALVFGALAPRAFAAAPPEKPAAAAEPSRPPAAPLTLQELKERLAKLASTPPPTELRRGAMCYDMAAPPETVDYVCPVDGSRTQYAFASGLIDLVQDLPAMRLAVKELPGLDASLDEQSMCRKCSPKGKASVSLVLKRPDGKTVRTKDVTLEDLQLLKEFLSGSLKHAGTHGSESALRFEVPRLRVLLGLQEG